jgi:phage terminase large subunit
LVEDGIQAVRSIFNKIYFEKSKTEKLLEALTIYRKKYDEKNNVYLNPIHDRSSNFADAMRYLAVNYE